MASKPITLAVQSQEGQKRVQIPASAKTDELYNNVKKVTLVATERPIRSKGFEL